MERNVELFNTYLKPFFGFIIILNLFHQVFSSGGIYLTSSFFDYFYKISMIIFIVELFIRFYIERKLTFLSIIDAAVLLNY